MKLLKFLTESVNIASFIDEIEESLEGYLEPSLEKARERYVYNNDSKALERYAKGAAKSESHYDALQGNLKRLGFPSTVVLYKGYVEGRDPIDRKYMNGSLDKSIAKSFRKAYFMKKIKPEQWKVMEFKVPRDAIIGVGHPSELELIFDVKKSKYKEIQ
jgi:hypothetical protein